MSKNNPLPPDHDLPPDMQQAVKKALTATDDLCPPPCYDATYWREEREAIARLAVGQAAQVYQERDGVSREAFAVICAKRAIYEEWRRWRERERGVVSIPVDEETGEEMEIVDAGALEALWEGVFCMELREALACLSEADCQLLKWYIEEGLSERAIAERLGCSHVAVHKRLHCAWSRLCRALGVEREFPGRRGGKSPKKGGKSG